MKAMRKRIALQKHFVRNAQVCLDIRHSDFVIFLGPIFDLGRANMPGLRQNGRMNITKNLGMLLLAIYLILAGVTLLFHITIPTIITGILALAAGILILIGK
jgi:hypothetical protein